MRAHISAIGRGLRAALRCRVAWLTLAAVAILGAATLGVYSAFELARFARAEVTRTTVVHASGQVLSPGVHVRAIELAGTLERLGYAESASPTAPGQFRRTPAAWDIRLLRGAEGPGCAHVRLALNGDRIARVDCDGRDVAMAVLEGEVLTGVGDRPAEDYRPVRLAEVPPVLVSAVLAAEDRRFFDHGALDVRGLARAVWANLRSGRLAQGGSTLTQQLVKSRLLTPRRTVWRKIQEAWLAVLVEVRYSKEQILEAYLNEIYLGQTGALAVRGVGAAARAHFGKGIQQLTTGEAALLAGMIRAPNTHSPNLNPRRARQRRDAVLDQMRALGTLSDAEHRRARREAVRAVSGPASDQAAPYFTDHVRQELERRFDSRSLHGAGGTRVVTTLDPVLQRFAERAVARGLDRLETAVPRLRARDPAARLQVALVAVDPASGQIRAMVGGRDYAGSQFNRAVMARRQPGSAFKPFVYAAALGQRDGRPRFTAASVVDDSPLAVATPSGPWTPRNYEDRYEGRVTVRRALERSLNAATVRIGQAVGPAQVVETARRFGFGDNLKPVPSVALGTFEVTPLELARAYLPFANAGLAPGDVTAVHAAYEADGTVVPTIGGHVPAAHVLSPAEAYVMTGLMQGVMRSGTGAAAPALGERAQIAGKTGTTNEGRDAWFVGYSPRLVAVVWVGFDDGRPHALSGAQAALPIWSDFMRQAIDAYPAGAFSVPAGVTFADVDSATGKRANGYCPLVTREAFLAGTEPELCREHAAEPRPVVEWWRRLRDWLPF